MPKRIKCDLRTPPELHSWHKSGFRADGTQLYICKKCGKLTQRLEVVRAGAQPNFKEG